MKTQTDATECLLCQALAIGGDHPIHSTCPGAAQTQLRGESCAAAVAQHRALELLRPSSEERAAQQREHSTGPRSRSDPAQRRELRSSGSTAQSSAQRRGKRGASCRPRTHQCSLQPRTAWMFFISTFALKFQLQGSSHATFSPPYVFLFLKKGLGGTLSLDKVCLYYPGWT